MRILLTVFSLFFTFNVLLSQELIKKKNEEGKYGYVNPKGEVVIDYVYDAAEKFINNRAIIMQNNEFGVIDIKGNLITKEGYAFIENYNDFGVAIVEVLDYDRYNLIDTLGNLLTNNYISIDDFDENGYAIVEYYNSNISDESMSLIDYKGNRINFDEYEDVERTANGLFLIQTIYDSEKLLLFNPISKEFVANQYEEIEYISYYGVLKVKKGNQWAMLDSTGKVPSGWYDNIDDNSFNYPRAVKNNQYLILNKNGVPISKKLFIETGKMSDGIIPVKETTGWGFISYEGKEITGFSYLSVNPFSEGLAAVQKESGWGYIWANGKELSAFNYQYVDDFKNSMAIVRYKDKAGVINQKNKFIVKPKYDDVFSASSNLFIVVEAQKTVLKNTIKNKYQYNNESIKDSILTISHKNYEVQLFFPTYHVINDKKKIIYTSEQNATCTVYNCILFSDINGNVLIKPDGEILKYDHVIRFYDDNNYKESVFFANNGGKEIISTSEYHYNYYEGQNMSVIEGGKFGILNNNGEEIFPVEYSDIRYNRVYDLDGFGQEQYISISDTAGIRNNSWFSNNDGINSKSILLMKREGMWGITNYKGEVMLDFQYDSIVDATEDLYVVYKKNEGMFMTRDSLKIASEAFNFHLPIYPINNEYSYFLANTGGELIANNQQNNKNYLTSDIVLENGTQVKGGKFSLYNSNGKKIVDDTEGIKFVRRIESSDEDYCLKEFYYGYSVHSKMGYEKEFAVSEAIRIVFPVMKNNRWGLIDNSGNTLIPLKYDFINFFEKGGDMFIYTCDKDSEYVFNMKMELENKYIFDPTKARNNHKSYVKYSTKEITISPEIQNLLLKELAGLDKKMQEYRIRSYTDWQLCDMFYKWSYSSFKNQLKEDKTMFKKTSTIHVGIKTVSDNSDFKDAENYIYTIAPFKINFKEKKQKDGEELLLFFSADDLKSTFDCNIVFTKISQLIK
jgi:WG containing repeat